MKITEITSEADKKSAFAVRIAIFVKEQGVDESLEIDEHEDEAKHIALWEDNKIIGTGRLREVKGKAKLERICVLREYRKLHAGKLIVEKLESLAKNKGLKVAMLHGQVQAQGFYEKLGYKCVSTPFMEDGILHVVLEKCI